MPDAVTDRNADQSNAPVPDSVPNDDTPYKRRPNDGSMQNPDPKDQSAAGKGAPEGVEDPWADDGRSSDRRKIDKAEKAGATDDGKAGKAGSDKDEDKDSPEPSESRKRRLWNKYKSKVTRKRAATGAAVAGGVAGISVVLMLAAIPLKIENMVQNLQSHFFSSSENAMEKAERKMFTKYVQKHVLPSYRNCRTTVSKNCSVKIIGNGKNPVSNMYRAWADAKLENKLATDYKIEFKLKASKGGGPDRWLMNDVDIGPNGEELDRVFTDVDKAEVRARVSKAFENETKWKKVWYHYKVGRLLEEKYGIRRCLAFCGVKDQFDDYKKEKKNSAKILITQRVITPRTQTLGIVMECLFDSACDPSSREQAPDEPGNAELQGTQQTETEREAQANFGKLVAYYGSTDKELVEKMIGEYNTISEKGYTKYIVEKLIEKKLLPEVTSKATDAAPIIGWIDAAATFITSLDKAGPFLKMATYITNAPAAVATYMSYRSYADEIHTGHVDREEVGSFVTSLGPGNHGNPNDPLVGGTAGAEQAPLYQAIVNKNSGSSSSSTALIDALLPAKAFASVASDSGEGETYKCEDDKPLEGLTCPEEKLGNNGNPVLDGIHDTLNTPPLSLITSVAHTWKGVLGGIFSLFGKALSWALQPFGFDKLTDFVSGIISPFFEMLAKQVVPNPFGSNMGGGRSFQMAGAGASVAGKDACDQIGCKDVPTAVAASIIDEQKATEMRLFDQKPLYARLFDTSNSNSLVTKVAMAVPLNYQSSLSTNAASIMSNPFGSVLSSFGSIFSDNRALAATSDEATDPFNIGSSAYLDSDIPDDLEGDWDARHCDDTSSDGPVSKWQDAYSVSEKTGMPIHTTAEPCLLIKAATGSGGGNYDTSLLTDDDRGYLGDGGASSDGSGSSSTGVGSGTISGSAKQIAQQILDQAKSGKITFAVLNSSDNSDGSTPQANIEEMAAGKPAKTTSNCSGRGAQPPKPTVVIDTAILKFILENSQKQNIIITAIAGQCHSSTSSMHYQGKAVDLGCPFDGGIGDSIGKKYGVVDTTGEYCSNAAHYHYSVGGG